jgi:hypothetical protein
VWLRQQSAALIEAHGLGWQLQGVSQLTDQHPALYPVDIDVRIKL